MNELEEFDYINNLYDIYRSMLTDKQILIMDSYYKFNLSLSEISAALKITRSAVLDTLKHSKEKLFACEDKLHVCKKIEIIKKKIEESNLDEKTKEEIIKELYYGI